MPPIRRLSLFSAGFLTAFALLPPSGRAASPAARVVSESAAGLTLRLSFPEPVRNEIEVGGGRYLSVQIPGIVPGSEAPSGSPDMPSRGFPFGLPEGTTARIVRSSVISATSFQGLPPVPVPERSIVPGDPLPSQTFRYVANPEAYASASLFPEDMVSLGPVFGLRHQSVQSLIVRPVRVAPSTGAYEAVLELEVELRFESSPGAPSAGRRLSVRTDAPGWEETYDRLLVNPGSSRSFRTRPAPAVVGPAIGPGDTYLRIRLGGSGLCRIPYADLAAEGWPAGVAVGNVRVEERGFNKLLTDPFTVVSMPRDVEDTNENGIFDGGDYLIFHGLNYRDRFNPPTITDARYSYFHTYWVTASGGPGTDWPVVEGFPSDTTYTSVTSFLQSEHFEQNLTYINNPKDSLPYLFPIYDALYWLLSNQKVVDLPFNIGDLAPGGAFRVRARWQGVNTALATRTHVVALDLNQQVLLPESQATTFCDLEPFLWEGTFQPMAGILTAGQNTLTVKAHASDNPSGCAYGTSQNQFSGALFDWFDIIYERVLVARNDQLTFNSGSATGPIELAVSGFSSPDILVLDITNPVSAFALTPNIQSQGATHTATIRVKVASNAQRKFIAIVRDAVSGLPPSAYLLPTDLGTKVIARGLPRDLLAEGEGSDYILITHPNFRDAWQPLVDHRQNLGHNVFVCDVWEIYDQFAGGNKTPWAIQRFLQQAFRNWDPSPSFVMLGGDANEDYRGDTPDSNPDWVPTQMHFGAVPGTSGPELAGTDAWYVQFLRTIDPEYDVLPEMNYGRIPAGSVTEVNESVQKILDYEAMSPADDWRQRGFFVADDQYSSGILSGAAYCWQGGEQVFRTTTLAVIDSIHVLAGLENFRTDVVLLSAHLDSVASLGRDPGPGDCPGASALAATTNYTRSRVTPGVIDSLSNGYAIWEFTGHANRSRMTHEVLLDHSSVTLRDMDKILNFGKPFLFMGYACHLMEYEYQKEAAGPHDNIGEALLMAPNRGAIGVFASSSYEWLPTNPLAQVYTTRPLFWNLPRDSNGRPRRLWGEAMMRGIVQLVLENPGAFGVIDMPRTYQSFGDPALRIDAYLSVWSSIMVDGEPWTEGQTLTAQSFADTIEVSAVVGDDVDIASIRAWNGTTPIPSSQITVTPPPPTQEGLQPYQVHLRTPLHLGSYTIRLEATDWAGVTSSLELPVNFETSFQSDGRPTGEGETVDREATITVLVNSPVPLTPGNFAVVVDSTARENIVPTGGPTEWQINVPGPWTEGQHRVEVRVSDPNATCVPGGCPLIRSLGFQAGGPPLDQVYFYPNPVEAEEGVFLYRLGENAQNAQVSIYSVTGRRIRRDDSPALAGLNSYRWDLRDEKGDRVANGVYLFVLRVEGQGGEVITNASSPEKVAITR